MSSSPETESQGPNARGYLKTWGPPSLRIRLSNSPPTVTLPNPVLELSYVDAVEYINMLFWRSEAAQKEKNQQQQW